MQPEAEKTERFSASGFSQVHQMISVRSQCINFLKDFSDRGFITAFPADFEA